MKVIKNKLGGEKMLKKQDQIVEYELIYKDYRLKFLNIGAAITEYSIAGHNIVLSFVDKENYRDNTLNLGAIVGRNSGRIRGGKIDGWQLPKNQDNRHTLHGGRTFQYSIYDVEIISKSHARLSVIDSEGAFPGEAKIQIDYELIAGGLSQTITAQSDKPTILDFTNHSYFNLDMPNTIENHTLKIPTAVVHELDADLLPVGDLKYKNSALDFTTGRTINSSLKQQDKQFKYSKGIDHPFKITNNPLLETDKYKLEIKTDCDYLIVYSGNYIADEIHKLNLNMNKDYGAICLETQGKPGDITLKKASTTKTLFLLSSK